jgi:GrpB-like predicted nucleotidyltransferase (UPF0157 family)
MLLRRPNQQYALLFRDFLRANRPGAAFMKTILDW